MKNLKILLSVLIVICIASSVSWKSSKMSRRLIAVQTFADNVLKKGRDRWSGQNTPLLADGINVNTGEPLEYIYNGEAGVRGEAGAANHWITHNLASQQNLFRTLTALTNLTNDPKYRDAAEKAIRYHFDNLRSESGLLRWGGHQLIDLRTLTPIGHAWRTNSHSHELKDVFPYYELMWDVDKEKSAAFIRAFWNAHVLNWETLEFNRHGGFGVRKSKLWDNKFNQQEPFFEADGLTFLNTGSDLIYAGGMLYFLNNEEGALKWSKLLAEQYVRARHPATGLGAYQFSKPTRHRQPPEGPLTGLLTFSNYGDRAENQFGKDFPGVAREGWALFSGDMYNVPALMQMELAERAGENGKEYLRWTLDGLKAFAKYAYNPEQNNFRPMWADGTDLTNYAFSRTGYYGPQGRVLKPYKASELYLFPFARAYRLGKDPVIWETLRSIFKGLDLGDPGSDAGKKAMLNLKTDNSDPYTIFALLELNRTSKNKAYLKLAEVIGDNIINRSFHKGFFLRNEDAVNANFTTIEPLALLSLEAALRGKPEAVPVFSGGSNHLDLKTE